MGAALSALSPLATSLGALLFLYRAVLGGDVGNLEGVVRGHRPQRLPVVLTEDEVRRVLNNLQGTPAMVAQILYGSGLRLMEALCLRIKDVDFEKNSIVVRDGKGDKDRNTMLPESLKASLQTHLTSVYALHSDACSSASSRHPQARKMPHIAPFFCNPPTGAGLRYPYDPGAAWS